LKRPRVRGSTLPEAIAALAIAAAAGTAAAESMAAAARRMEALAVFDRCIDAARAHLALTRAAPCAPSPPCPPGLACALSVSPGPTVQSRRIRVRVASADGSVPAFELETLGPRPTCP
jgi:hypothetical protein